jgi:putative DNA primase/helicase
LNPCAENGRTTTLASLAAAKALPVEFLAELGVQNLPGGGVGIPYYEHPNGEQLFVRERDSPRRKGKRFWQPTGIKLAAYGQWRIEAARKLGFLVIVEGESDCWVIWHHELPALGVPGSSSWGVLVPEWLEQVGRVYIVREPDQGGNTFVRGVAGRLKAIGYAGEVCELRMPDGLKDPADLHCADPGNFFRAFGLAMRDAVRLDTPPRPETEADGVSLLDFYAYSRSTVTCSCQAARYGLQRASTRGWGGKGKSAPPPGSTATAPSSR